MSTPAIVPPAIAPLLLSFLPVDNWFFGARVDAGEAIVIFWVTAMVLEVAASVVKKTAEASVVADEESNWVGKEDIDVFVEGPAFMDEELDVVKGIEGEDIVLVVGIVAVACDMEQLRSKEGSTFAVSV